MKCMASFIKPQKGIFYAFAHNLVFTADLIFCSPLHEMRKKPSNAVIIIVIITSRAGFLPHSHF